jgi:hypothetical protein
VEKNRQCSKVAVDSMEHKIRRKRSLMEEKESQKQAFSLK